MASDTPAWSLLIRSTFLQILAISLLATVTVSLLWHLAPVTFTAWDWSIYDSWLRLRKPVPISSSIVLITRDQAGESVFGTGSWDRALIARVVSALHDVGASVIGVDFSISDPSLPHLGGAVSDALLAETTKTAGNVVYTVTLLERAEPALPLIAQQAKAVGHLLQTVHSDHVVRQIPLHLHSGQEASPAFGLSLATAFWQLTPEQITVGPNGGVTVRDATWPDGRRATFCLPVDQDGRLLVNYAGDDIELSANRLAFVALWELIEQGQTERLTALVKDKVVVLLIENARGLSRTTPMGRDLSDAMIHTHLLNTLLTENWISRLSSIWETVLALALSGLATWVILSLKGWKGLSLAIGFMVGYPVILLFALISAGWVLPLMIPLSAGALVIGGATFWSHLLAGQRVLLLERDMLRVQQEAAAVREALVLRENRAEALQEDLDTARAEVAQSTDRQEDLSRSAEALRTELVEVQAQEEAARQKLDDLSRELAGLRAVAGGINHLGDAELERLRDECRQLGIVTQNHQLLGLFRDLKKGAKSLLPGLLLGEPGTGKELFARAIHRLSPRAGKPFIAVNMAAISPELFESELFGHVKGSFTGASQDRRGYFELAHYGTLFLDEIGDLRLEHQGKLLRVLQEKTFYRVGATTPTTVDVRVVAATNRDLQRGLSEGWFREDLYFRLKGLVFRLPPLRDRQDDIGLLAEHCLADTAKQLGQEAPKITQEALDTLLQHEWKGNIRELRQCLEQAVTLAERSLLTKEDLRLQALTSVSSPDRSRAPKILPEPASDAAVLDCLRLNGFDMQATAKALGWDRSTVTQRLKGLCFQSLVEAAGDKAQAATTLAGDPSLTRTVELKLMDYYDHLLATIQPFATVEEALLDCKRRFKNLPDRHFRSVETLVQQYFVQRLAPAKSAEAQ